MRLFQWLEETLGRFLKKPTLGRRGEAAAERFLRAKGYRILARGARAKPGEIDLIAEDRGTVVFVEVKTRRSDEQGNPAEAVDAVKQQRLSRLALAWLKRRRLLDYPARFDIVAITWPEGERKPRIEHIRSAFESRLKDSFF